MKSFLVFGVVFFMPFLNVYSQVNGKVRGFIFEKGADRPVEFAIVGLIHANDSMMVKNTTTDLAGNFEFEGVTEGKYKVWYSFVGFAKTFSLPFEVSSSSNNVDLGKLYFIDTPIVLGEVQIVGRKSLFESSIDRKTYNVSEDVMSKAGSVSDVMQNIPTVQVDVNGSISLRGSSNVTILINGKPSGMLSNNPGAVLQQMPANMIEKIEIITNPSAKFRPDGTAGIINIVTKKNKGLGLNGNITANMGNDERYNGGVLLNYNPGKLTVSGNYCFRQDDYQRLSDSYTEKLENGVVLSNIVNLSNSHSRPVSNLMGLEIGYEPNKKNYFDVKTNYSHIFQCRDEDIGFRKDTLGNLLLDYNRNRHPPKLETNLDFGAMVQHKFMKEGHELTMDCSNSFYTESTDNSFTNTFRFPEAKFMIDKTYYRHYIQNSQFSIDYTNPFSKTSKLEVGYKLDYKKNKMNINCDTISTNQYEPAFADYSRTTRFFHDEFTNSIYATYLSEYGNFGLLAGLRGEITCARSNIYSYSPVIRQTYARFYPSLHMSYKITESNELQLNYSRRIRRPDDEQLNPYPQYLDLWNIPKGNPFLEPEDIHSTELGYRFKKKFVNFLITLYYRYTQNGITSITEAHGDTLISTLYNLSKSQVSGGEMIFSTAVGKLATINISSNTFYNVIDASALGYGKNKSNISFTAKAGVSIYLFKSTVWQLSSNYTGERLTPQGKLLPSYVLNTGIKQKLFKAKGAFIVTVSDVFNSLRSNLLIDTPELQRREYRKRSARVVYLGFTYSFGSNSKKEKESSLQYDNKM